MMATDRADAMDGVAGTPSLVPVPDPTALTTDLVLRAQAYERLLMDAKLDVIRQRLDAIDKATSIFTDNLQRVPSETDKSVGNLKELHSERFKTVELQFKERDTRALRESADAKEALAAALSAAKEAVAEQNKSNSLAISKSEAGTVETINKLSELVDVNIKGLSREISDLKERVNRADGLRLGGTDKRDDYRANIAIAVAVLAVIASVVFGIYAATGR